MIRFRAVLFVLFGSLLAGKGEDHWAFQPIPDSVSPPSAERQPIDAFIRAKLNEVDLEPAGQADHLTLVRRLFLDMHGLPPTGEKLNEDYEELVEVVLSSPRYGERWAQHWLDIVRYADTHGFEVNTPRPNAWPYRDYVIRAFNEDKPYDRFVFEQLAGDSVGENAATGFMVASAVLLPGQIGKDDASKRLARQDSLDEIIVATGDTFLAMSIGCSRCHDHKFDPIPQRDYYAMQAFFAGVEYGDRPLRDPGADQRRAEQLAHIRAETAAISKRLDAVRPKASALRTIYIDDEDAERTTPLFKKNGHGANPAGEERGYKDDPGGADRIPNISGGRYTWWTNTPGKDAFTYDPGVEGKFRLWLSWGVHGSGVHTRDARYVLDLDGDLATKDDQKEIANVDQYYFEGVTEGETEKKPMWSGLFDAGMHELFEASRLIVRGGGAGTGITADVIVLQEELGRERFPGLRAPVDPGKNVEQFKPVKAKFVRFTTHATIDNNKHEPCIDELEVYTAGNEPQNVALAKNGTKASSSGNYSDIGIHQLPHIHDGKYGNSWSWISNELGGGWVQLEFPEPVVVDRVEWGRDREGKYKDRLALNYQIDVALEPGEWETVARSDDRLPHGTPYDPVAATARWVPDSAEESLRTDVERLVALESERKKTGKQQMVYAGKFRKPDATHVLLRGDAEQKRERVAPAVPTALGKLQLDEEVSEQERRIALAKWIGSAENPLTARVMANRIWQYHFGQGLVKTPSDFGLSGAKPSHPELLDWLAREFIRSGWSIKHLHRLILTSETYKQSNRINPRAAEIDGNCRLLWRFPSRRLEAEAIRDSILAVSGKLNLKMGGPGFDFFKSRGGLSGFPPVDEFKEEGLRRMIYAHKVRMERVPVFGAFDCPDAGQAMPQRSRATTAIQALNLFNSPFVMEQADAFAKRIGEGVVGDQVRRAYEFTFGREPTAIEAEFSEAAVREHGLPMLCRVLFNSNEFLYLP